LIDSLISTTDDSIPSTSQHDPEVEIDASHRKRKKKQNLAVKNSKVLFIEK